ncbi:MAG: hypothetical protein ACOYKE_13535, partial [Ferruginibacter sp.]
TADLYTPSALKQKHAGILYTLDDSSAIADKPYKKSFQLFNFHSSRPAIDDPEFSYSLLSDNVLSSFTNQLTYMYNRSDLSHALSFDAAYGGWFAFFNTGAAYNFNRNIDTAVGKTVQYNTAKIQLGSSIPLQWIGKRTSKYLNIGGNFTWEQLYYRGIGKNVFDNKALQYLTLFASWSNANQQAQKHIHPRWAQAISLSYRKAYTFINSKKFVANTAWYFPGLFPTHSLVINGSYQQRDRFPDIFSNTFSYSRGYLSLSTRRMYKVGVNYHFPIVYPDAGLGNIVFIQRIRANGFYDYTSSKARVNGILTEIKNRSTGAEIYFDTKVWNALPVTLGFRYSRLLDKDLRNPGAVNRWEIILPVGLIPN